MLATLAILPVGACGGESETDPELSLEESSKVAEYNVAFANTVLDSSMYGKTLRGVDYLIELCREKPDAIYQPGDEGEKRTMRQVVEDGANTLRKYQPDLAAELETVSDSGCE